MRRGQSAAALEGLVVASSRCDRLLAGCELLQQISAAGSHQRCDGAGGAKANEDAERSQCRPESPEDSLENQKIEGACQGGRGTTKEGEQAPRGTSDRRKRVRHCREVPFEA